MIWWNGVMGAYCFLAGLVFGSFLNVVVYRVPRGIGVAKGRSFCPACGHTLGWRDLFPVFSYLILRGRCRYCGAPIGSRCLLVELLTGLAFLAAYVRWGLTVFTPLAAAVCFCLLAVAFIDIDFQIIPDRFSVLLLLLGGAFWAAGAPLPWQDRLIGLACVSLPLLALSLLTGGMGEGDVKLFAALGFLLGWKQILLTLLLSSVAAAVFGVVQMARGRAERRTAIPFGPFIAFSGMAVLLAGEAVLGAYEKLLGI